MLETGAIDSLDDPVDEIRAGARRERLRRRVDPERAADVLRREFDEDYFDFWSDINQMGRVLALGASMDSSPRGSRTGTGPRARHGSTCRSTRMCCRWCCGARPGRPARPHVRKDRRADGSRGEPYYVTDGYGVAFALGGLNFTTRDYARMGQTLLKAARSAIPAIVPGGVARRGTAPSAPTDPGRQIRISVVDSRRRA